MQKLIKTWHNKENNSRINKIFNDREGIFYELEHLKESRAKGLYKWNSSCTSAAKYLILTWRDFYRIDMEDSEVSFTVPEYKPQK